MASLGIMQLVVLALMFNGLCALRLWGGDKSVKKARTTGRVLFLTSSSGPAILGGGVSARSRRSALAKPTVTSLLVTSNINSRFAATGVSSRMSNSESENQEARFVMQIPETAFISNFSMKIDGSWFVAEVKEKAEAKREYEEAKNENKTAGLVGSDPHTGVPERGMEFFLVSVNVRANSDVEFQMEYLELIQRRHGVYEQRISIRPNQTVQTLGVAVRVYEPQGIRFIDVIEPSTGSNAVGNVIASVTHTSAEVKEVAFHPSVQQQREMDANIGINSDLIVRYDTEHPYDAGLIQFEGDYFVHFFSPSDASLVPLRKNVVFVIDISGSMSGDKMDQTRDSMQVILGQLRPADSFLLLLFDDELEYWPSSQSLVQASANNIKQAKVYANDRLRADGGTNINAGLLRAAQILRTSGEPGANMIVFLTDGEATSGVTDRGQIIANAAEAAGGKAAIFSLGYGFSLDFDLLAGVSYKTGGFAKRIYEGVDAAVQLENFFNEVNTPLAYNVELVYETDQVDFSSLTKYKFPQYFNGSEIIVAGKLKASAAKTLNTKVKFTTDQDKELPKTVDTSVPMPFPPEAVSVYRPGFLERLYVYMKIKDLLLMELVTDDKAQKKELESYALQLALDYNLVTPLTSLIVVQPDQQTNNWEEDMAYGPGGYPSSHAASYHPGLGGYLFAVLAGLVSVYWY